MEHLEAQRRQHDLVFADGSRNHTLTDDPMTRFLVRWRILEGFRRLQAVAGERFGPDSPILIMCAGEGSEGSALCDAGHRNVTVSDISPNGVKAAIERDPRLKGVVLNAEDTGLAAGSYAVVGIQDGLHHLQSPIRGYTEMLRMSSLAVMFFEPHRSLVGHFMGTEWERNGDAVNYVFRWNRRLVDDVTRSYLGPDAFDNVSFPFWHHPTLMDRFGHKLGNGPFGIGVLKAFKATADTLIGFQGNEFCGLVVKRPRG